MGNGVPSRERRLGVSVFSFRAATNRRHQRFPVPSPSTNVRMDPEEILRRLRFRLSCFELYKAGPSGQILGERHKDITMAINRSEGNHLHFFVPSPTGSSGTIMRLDLEADEFRVILHGDTCYARMGKAPGVLPINSNHANDWPGIIGLQASLGFIVLFS